MPDSSPIPIPARHHWREFRIKRLPLVTFCAALLAVVFIWKDHIAAPSFTGEVETIRANVISTLPGLLVEMNVERFEKVSKGQILGKVYPADPELLKSALAAVEIELRTLQAQIVLNQDRNKVNYEQVRLDLLSQRVELATAKVNLQFAENELRRATLLHDEKILSDSLYETAQDFRDVRREEVKEKTKLVAEMEKSLSALNTEENSHSPTNSSLREAIAAQEAQLLLKEGPITLTAPIAGVITALNHHSGERLVAGLPILTITSPQANRIIAFARQPLQRIPQVGDRVQVRTRSNPRKTGMSSVMQVSSGIDVMVAPQNNSERDFPTALGNPMERGLAFSVAMPEGMSVYPGETVDLIVIR